MVLILGYFFVTCSRNSLSFSDVPSSTENPTNTTDSTDGKRPSHSRRVTLVQITFSVLNPPEITRFEMQVKRHSTLFDGPRTTWYSNHIDAGCMRFRVRVIFPEKSASLARAESKVEVMVSQPVVSV